MAFIAEIRGADDVPRTSFRERIRKATDHEARTRAALEELGWTCEPFGQGVLTERGREALKRTQSAVRWMPDLFAVREGTVVFVDAKTATRMTTPNWTIEVAAYDAGTMFQAAFNHPVVYVWNDLTANTHDALNLTNRAEPWGGHTSGSGTPFYLVRKSDQQPLATVLTDVLSQANVWVDL